MVSSSSNEPPPAANPILTAYDSFQQNTPLVTRSLLSIQAVSYLFSWFFDPRLALGNTPYYTILRLEIYRILLSPLVNDSLLSLVFAFLSFQHQGRRLERSLGSIRFLWFCLWLGCLTNVAFLIVSFLLTAMTGSQRYLFQSSYGIWIILFGTIAMECVQCPRSMTRKLFVTDVPVLYYPVALYALFAVLSGFNFSLANLISIGLGYLIGFASDNDPFGRVGRHVERVALLSSAKAQQWEETSWMQNVKNQPGWIIGNASLGSDAWSSDNITESGGMNLPLFRPMSGSTAESSSSNSNSASFTGAGSVYRTARETSPHSGTTTSTPQAADQMPAADTGRALGGATRRGGGTTAAEARAARLEALEKRQKKDPPKPKQQPGTS